VRRTLHAAVDPAQGEKRAGHRESRAGDLWRERFVSAGAVVLDEPALRLGIDALYEATELSA